MEEDEEAAFEVDCSCPPASGGGLAVPTGGGVTELWVNLWVPFGSDEVWLWFGDEGGAGTGAEEDDFRVFLPILPLAGEGSLEPR